MPLSFKLSRTKRLLFVIISCTIYFFFEITIGLKTGALALIVDAFHQLNDLIAYIVALVATRKWNVYADHQLAMSTKERPGFTFALKRCELVGAFFNASILLALALSIFLQSIERFINVPEVDNPFLVFIVGCVGLLLNSLCIVLSHDTHTHSHGHSHGRNHPHLHPSDEDSKEHRHVEHNHGHHDPSHAHGDESHPPHDHTHSSFQAAYYPSLEEEIRAVRIPSIVTQIARPLTHILHDHRHSHAQQCGHDHERPQQPNRPSTNRFSDWRKSLFHQDAEAMKQYPNTVLPVHGRKHHSLDPGSPKYVHADSQRWYDMEKFPTRPPSDPEADITADLNNTRLAQTHRCNGNHAHRHQVHAHGHTHAHDHTHTAHDHDHDVSHSHPHDHAQIHHRGKPANDHFNVTGSPADNHAHHGHNHNLGFAGVFLHLIGDALNNIGVVVATILMWQLDSPKRFYADPAGSVLIGIIIFAGSLPLTISSARVLLEAAPKGLDLKKVEEELVKIPGVASIHCLHVWQLTETDLIASLNVQSEARDLVVWSLVEKHIRRHLSTLGINHVTISPEFVQPRSNLILGGSPGVLIQDTSRQCAVLPSPVK